MNNKNFLPGSEFFLTFETKAEEDKKELVAAGLIINNDRKIFVQKRMMNRKLFRGCWDIAGGHVEKGETIYSALEREIEEETGWHMERIIDVVDTFDWESSEKGRTTLKREIDFIVEVTGDLNNPVIEKEKFSEYRWISKNEIELLKENRAGNDFMIYELVKKAFEKLEKMTSF